MIVSRGASGAVPADTALFYSAAQPIVNTRMFRAYDWDHARGLVDRCLGEY